MKKIRSYPIVKIYDRPAWDDEAEYLEDLVNIQSVNMSLTREITPDVGNVVFKESLSEEPNYVGKGIKIYAYAVEADEYGETETAEEIYGGLIVSQTKNIEASSLTHRVWEISFEDVVSCWEGAEINIDVQKDEGISTETVFAPLRQLPRYSGTGYSFQIRKCQFSGNGIEGIKAELTQTGFTTYGGKGRFTGTDLIRNRENVSIVKDTRTIPEVNGIKIKWTNNSPVWTSIEGSVSVVYLTKNRQWWIPAAWEDEESETYKLHVVYLTYLSHPSVPISSNDSEVYQSLFFGSEAKEFSVIGEAEMTENYDYTSLNEVTLVQPADQKTETAMFIHKTYEYTEMPENTSIGPNLLSRFLKETPQVITLSFSSTNLWEEGEYETGGDPKMEIDVLIRKASAIDFAACELAERRSTDELALQYDFDMTRSIALPEKISDGNTFIDTLEGRGYFLRTTNISWSEGEPVNITSLFALESQGSAYFQRISKSFIPQYFKKKLKTQIDQTKKARYCYIKNGVYVFVQEDGTETEISADNAIIGENGLVTWR